MIFSNPGYFVYRTWQKWR